jgi:hypothetical protein
MGVVFLAACEDDHGVTKFSKPPVVAITTPADGSTLNEGVVVDLRGHVVDEVFEGSLTSITPTWTVDGGTICQEAVFDINGNTSCSTVFSRGTTEISLTALNPDGESATATITVEVAKNDAPTAEIIEPATGGDYYANQLTLFEGQVADGEDLADELTVQWTSSIDGVLPLDAKPSSDGKATGTYQLSEGEHQITLLVTDKTGRTGSDTTVVDVLKGSRPELNLVSPVSGDKVNVGDTVVFEATVSDREDAPDQLTFSWESSIDGVFSTQGAGSDGTVDFAYGSLSHGVHTITVSATDTDGITATDSATLYVNEPPEAPIIHISPDPAGSSDALTVVMDSGAYDADGDPITYEYYWYLNGVDSGLASNPLPASATTRGDLWTVYVIPSDGASQGPAGVDSVTIGNGAPTLTSVTITPGTAYTDDTLTAVVSGYADPDGDAELEEYQWYVNGVVVPGATDVTLEGAYFVKGDAVTVDATPFDGRDRGAAVTSGVRTIQNSAPTTPSVDVTPNYPEDDDDLLCSVTGASTDADGDTITYSYAWADDGVVSAVTSKTVAAAYTTDGESWVCTVTASDGTATSGSAGDSVLVGDYTSPDAPVLNSLDPYRNENSATVTGSTEAFATVTLYIACTSGTTTDTATANGAGTFSFTESITAGDECSFYATSTDSSGNTSGVSNVVGTEVCDPGDDYEDTTSYGDSCGDPVVDWSTLDADGTTTIEFNGNILDGTDDDWYLIQTADTISSTYNPYRFHVELTSGSSDYGFVVYDGGCTSDALECGSGSSTDPEGSGYSEYEVYAEDVGDGTHTVPSDTRTCGTGSYYNNCDDLSSDYYIHVFRTTSGYSCQGYSLKVTNGVW